MQIFRNGRIVLPTEIVAGSVAVESGLISAIDAGSSAVDGIDLEGDLLLPGLIDVHSDNIEKHIAPRPNVVWPGTYAAIAHDADVIGVGITTILDAIALSGHEKGIDRTQLARGILDGLADAKRVGALRADHLIHLRCEVPDAEIVARLMSLGEAFPARLMSLMDHTPGQRVFPDIAVWRDYRKKGQGLSDAELDVRLAAEQEAQARYAVPNRRALAAIAHERRIPLAGHDDSTPADVEEAVSLGSSLSEFPTTLAAARLARERGMRVIMGAPNLVRGGSHIGNVSTAECAREGVLDILASDYMPVSLLHAVFLLSREAVGMSLPQAVATATSAPAKACGLDDRGEIAVGKVADLLQVREVDGVPVLRAVWRGGVRVH